MINATKTNIPFYKDIKQNRNALYDEKFNDKTGKLETGLQDYNWFNKEMADFQMGQSKMAQQT